ncbi:MAG TPA: aminofutalosine synthase MqnE [Bacteroidia bacterium]|nr:aminofutalosine synthase MqnE [Bacteroidia bacterium]
MSLSKPSAVEYLLTGNTVKPHLRAIGEKVLNSERISVEEAVNLYREADLGFAGALANHIRQKLHGDFVYFNRNFHIEPTNICVFDCKFCSYSRLLKQKDGQWELSAEQMLDIVRSYKNSSVTEVHIVGGVHPKLGLTFFGELLSGIREIMPQIHIKAFTAVELEYMFRKAKVTIEEGLLFLKEHGLNSLPGGGAEIFDENIREQIAADKCTSAEWLKIHETAHRLGIPSNCTMLYGHVETYEHRADHMNRLRELQERTKGFNTFIPLRFRNKENQMSHVAEASVIEDMKNFAVARIFMDNIAHLKAYWPMLGRTNAQLSLNFGVDDIDGTIDDSTKIYVMAGSEEQKPALSTREMLNLIKNADRHPVERDSLYNPLKDYKNHVWEDEKATHSN